ncbi:MAG: hypothetical protein IPP10_15545 [Candidatus Competibacteraceae bacterium]|nr:hypothetical protein [Candidatus Competibacteraceae bacterium]
MKTQIPHYETEPKCHVGLRIEPTLRDYARNVGGGSVTKGVRYLIIKAYEQEQLCATQVSSNKSGVVGVSWAADRNKWYVQLKFNGKLIPGGHYESFEDAVAARRQLEIDYGVADYAVVTACTSPKPKTLDPISVFQHFNR